MILIYRAPSVYHLINAAKQDKFFRPNTAHNFKRTENFITKRNYMICINQTIKNFDIDNILSTEKNTKDNFVSNEGW